MNEKQSHRWSWKKVDDRWSTCSRAPDRPLTSSVFVLSTARMSSVLSIVLHAVGETGPQVFLLGGAATGVSDELLWCFVFSVTFLSMDVGGLMEAGPGTALAQQASRKRARSSSWDVPIRVGWLLAWKRRGNGHSFPGQTIRHWLARLPLMLEMIECQKAWSTDHGWLSSLHFYVNICLFFFKK